jgi:multimeric flavodoxin WrbA
MEKGKKKMKIVVLNGSPKGDLSISLQYARYLAKVFPEAEYQTIHIAQRIKVIENNRQVFDDIIQQIREADGVLWVFPLYILLVHAHYKRFIELISERKVQGAFAGKYAAILSTSIHYFDHTAHNYMHGICDDLGMKFVDSFSAEMYDLTKAEGQHQLDLFGRNFLDAITRKAATWRAFPPIVPSGFHYLSGAALAPIPTEGKKVVILHDATDPNSNLAKMVTRCQAAFEGDVNTINLHELDIKASCQGCLQCGSDNQCAYEGKDGFIDFYRTQVMTADVVVYAGTVVDRYLSSRWKMFFDRCFFNTHTPVLKGKQVVYIISGPLGQLPNLVEIIQAFMELQQANLVGFVTDESGSSSEIDRLLDEAMTLSMHYSRIGFTRPATFLGIGGMDIFRDDIFGRLRPVFASDHRAYSRLGIYNTFPQRDWRTQLTNLLTGIIFRIPMIQKGFKRQIKTRMVQPLQKVVEMNS